MGLPYGAPRPDYPTGNVPTDYRFTGQRSKEASLGSLYDYGARFYSPVLGRFLSADTIVPSPGNPQSLNRFAYVSNNPLKYVDPTGHVQACPDNDCGTPGTWTTLNARVYFLNPIGNSTGMITKPNPNPKDENGYIVYRLGVVAGPEKVKSIPIFIGDYDQTRKEMVLEAFGIQDRWKTIVANTISQDLKDNPLASGESLIIVGNSGGGTIAIETLDLLEKKGISVEQVILRGSLVMELSLHNVKRVDYIAPRCTFMCDPYYSADINPFDSVQVHEHRVGNLHGHQPRTDEQRMAIGDLISQLIGIGW